MVKYERILYNSKCTMPSEEQSLEYWFPDALPVALEADHFEALEGIATQYRALLTETLQPFDEALPTPEWLLPLAEAFVRTSDSQVEMDCTMEMGLRFTYYGDTGNTQEFFHAQQLCAELAALGTGGVSSVDFSGGVTYRIPLPNGKETHWFFAPTYESRPARRFFAEHGGHSAYQAYRLSYRNGDAEYWYWQPPDAPAFRDVLASHGAILQAEAADGSEFYVTLQGEACTFAAHREDPLIFVQQAKEQERQLLRLMDHIHALLPPLQPGLVRMFRGIEGVFTPRLPLSEEEWRELRHLQDTFDDWCGDTKTGERFGDLFARSRGEMCTPDLHDVLRQYANGPDATLLYVDVTQEVFQQYRDAHALAGVFSGYTTFPTGAMQWHALRMADVRAEGS